MTRKTDGTLYEAFTGPEPETRKGSKMSNAKQIKEHSLSCGFRHAADCDCGVIPEGFYRCVSCGAHDVCDCSHAEKSLENFKAAMKKVESDGQL